MIQRVDILSLLYIKGRKIIVFRAIETNGKKQDFQIPFDFFSPLLNKQPSRITSRSIIHLWLNSQEGKAWLWNQMQLDEPFQKAP